MAVKKISILYDGQDLANFVDAVSNIKRSIGPGWTNHTESIGNGVDFLYSTRNSKSISFDFMISGTVQRIREMREKLAVAISQSAPAPLIFGDEPNKVWYAVPDGEQDLSGQPENPTGTLTFLVPSGVAESVDTKVLNIRNSGEENGKFLQNEDGSVTAEIHNAGSLEAYPQIKIKHTADNGYIGLVGMQGVLELGSIDQTLVSSKTIEAIKYKSNWLLEGKRSQASNFEKFGNSKDTNMQNRNLKTDGTLAFQNDGLRLTSMGTPPVTGTWLAQGGFKKFTLPVDENKASGAKYFSSYMNILAWAGKMGQTGVLQVLYVTNDNKLVCGFGIYKDDYRGNTARAQFYIGGNDQRTFYEKKFSANNAESNQKPKNKNEYFNTRKGGVTLTKTKDGNFKWSLSGLTKTMRVPELEDKKISAIYVYIGQMRGRKLSTQEFVSNLVLRELNFRKDDVAMYFDESTDVTTFVPANPSHYGSGETLLVDMGAAKVFKKDGTLPGNDEVVRGSEFFGIVPGISKLDFVFSDTMKTLPEIEITWKERYL